MSSAGTDTTESTALYAASTGPVPMAERTRSMPSGPRSFSVAVGMPIVPHTTCRSSSAHVLPAYTARTVRGVRDGAAPASAG